VVDDGSTDGTPDFVAAHYKDAVRVLRQTNGGVARARNRGWRAARGQWIAFLDHDDEWLPQKLERMMHAARPETGVIVSRWREEDENGEIERESPVFETERMSKRAAFAWLFGWNSPLVSMSVPLVRRDLLAQIGGFDARCAPADDWDLWLRLARVTDFGFVNEITTIYHLHPNQQRLDEARMFRAVRRVLGRYPLELSRRPLLLWWLVWSGAFVPSIPAYKRAQNGEFSATFDAVRAHPLTLLSPQWLRLLAVCLRR
jgi:glycosyltransferase involved in cell wall biosynthesis